MKQAFSKLVSVRQSCRDFNDKPLDTQTVVEIARQSMLCPSACNSQPWKMYLVTQVEKLEQVRQAVQGHGHNKFTDKAKAFICVSERTATLRNDVGNKFDRNHFVKYDVGELVAYITLTAESMGVQSCIIGWVDKVLIDQALELPSDESCNLVVALGYSDIPVRQKARKSEEEIIKQI